jgi:phospholipase C
MSRKISRKISFFIVVILSIMANATSSAAQEGSHSNVRNIDKIQHIIVIVLENHSFDNMFGYFPGADGIANAANASIQLDKSDKPYSVLPLVINTETKPEVADKRFPDKLANKPFAIEKYVPANEETGDLVHEFYHEQLQINGGKMNKFAAFSNAGGLAMGYYDGSKTALWQYAKQYTLADHFFHSAFGGSFLNHMWLICACTPRFENAPNDMVIKLDKDNHVLKRGSVTPEGYAVNITFSSYNPHPAAIEQSHLLPPIDKPTIGDRLSEKNIGWAWYSGGWNDALAGKADKTFQFHHQPFAYFKQYADGTKAKTDHLKDEADFLSDIKNGTLPAVSFYKPLGEFNLHPGYAKITNGDAHIANILKSIENSRAWKNTVVIVTFDENGGYWDHVSPPKIDQWGPGSRVPAIIISPFARKGFIDHTIYDTTSILKFIETRYGLKPLGTRDAEANDLSGALILN